MNAFTLHLPEGRGFSRWTLAGVTILMAHAAIVAAVALWYARRPVEPNILPAIAVFAPVESSSPEIQNQDIAVGPAMQQAEAAPKEPPKVEEKPRIGGADATATATGRRHAAAGRAEASGKAEAGREAARAGNRAPPKTEQVGQFTQAGSEAYNALVFGHLQRFKRYPSSARGAQGTVVVSFVLNRAGDVIESAVTKSSGNEVLDGEALEILRRASPFPAFPAAKPGAQDIYIAPVNFAH